METVVMWVVIVAFVVGVGWLVVKNIRVNGGGGHGGTQPGGGSQGGQAPHEDHSQT